MLNFPDPGAALGHAEGRSALVPPIMISLQGRRPPRGLVEVDGRTVGRFSCWLEFLALLEAVVEGRP